VADEQSGLYISLGGVWVPIAAAGASGVSPTLPSGSLDNILRHNSVDWIATDKVKVSSVGLVSISGGINSLEGTYYNWGPTTGATGYGFRDNAGNLEFKDTGGAWTDFGTGTGTGTGSSLPSGYLNWTMRNDGNGVSGWVGTGAVSVSPSGGIVASGTVESLESIWGASKVDSGDLVVHRNVLASGNYYNFGTVFGSEGFGLRSNVGAIEFKSSGGSWAGIGTGSGAGAPSGVTTTIQYNNGGVFGGDANLTWSGTTMTVTGYVDGVAPAHATLTTAKLTNVIAIPSGTDIPSAGSYSKGTVLLVYDA